MSKQKSTKTETQRFSGPELSELLDRVARQHGADAAIQAVNKIRSGGVAGFFCREEFEVVVQAKAQTNTQTKSLANVEQPAPEPDGEPKSDIAPGTPGAGGEGGDAIGQARSDIAPSPGIPTLEGGQRSRSDIDLATKVAAASATPRQFESQGFDSQGFESQQFEMPNAAPQPSDDVFAGPRPVIASETQDRFRALLEQRLDDVSEAEFGLSESLGSAVNRVPASTNRVPASTRRSAPVPAARPEPNLQPIVPAPGLPISQQTVSGGVGVMTPAALTTGGVQTPDFWIRLQRVQHELASFMPLASATVATIGPLSLITPIVRRLRTQPRLESADVIVLTDRAEIVSEPTWQLVRSGHQLVDAVIEQADWPTLVLIDVPVELPNWVAPLENRLRIAGVGLFRYAVPGNPTAEQLDSYRLGSDVPYVIDLISRVRPESLVDFVEKRHPIASVSGADLNAELLLAMREQVAIGT